jgi:hypothetical protein
MELYQLYLALDSFLIAFYRITGYAFVDFLMGTFVLAALALIIGEFTISVLFLINRKHIDKTTAEVARFQNLSVEALAAGDKQAYQAANKLANEAFGKSFFLQIALSAGSLWPIFFALAWMQERFSDVEFRLLFTDWHVGYICVFVLMYASAYLLFKRIKHKLPYFRNIKRILDVYDTRAKEMKTLQTIVPSHSRATNTENTHMEQSRA